MLRLSPVVVVLWGLLLASPFGVGGCGSGVEPSNGAPTAPAGGSPTGGPPANPSDELGAAVFSAVVGSTVIAEATLGSAESLGFNTHEPSALAFLKNASDPLLACQSE